METFQPDWFLNLANLIPREIVRPLMIGIDTIASLAVFYCAMAITQSFGFGSRRALMQLGHRVALLLTSFWFAVHAEEIWRVPGLHGLSTDNMMLHVFFTITVLFSSARLRRFQKEQEMGRVGQNGGAFVGPFLQSRAR